MANRSWSIGGARVTKVVETQVEMPPTGLLPEATPEAIGRHAAWLKPHFLTDAGNFTLSIHALVVESEGKRIVVDTCVGDRPLPGYGDMAEGNEVFLRDFAAAGFEREAIDFVLCTHLHFDHVGWNTMLVDGRWVPTFPNARYLFAKVEYDHWSKSEDRSLIPSFEDTVTPVVEAGLADLVDDRHAITGEVSLEPTPGHTPGHVAVKIESRGERALITGDLTHHPVQWAEPEWAMSADSDSPQAGRTRRRLIREHGDRPTLVIGTHYAGPTAGHIRGANGGWIFEAQG